MTAFNVSRGRHSIAYGHEKRHAAEMHAGLMVLGPDFNAVVCHMCDGEGQYEQTYTAGCGGGYFKSMGGCDHCDGMGLLQHGRPASISVIIQVGIAGTKFLGDEK